MTVNRLLINLITDKLSESAKFYTNYFDFEVDFESDWFIHLISEDKQLELGLINQTSEIVPARVSTGPGGMYLTLVVDNVDELYQRLEPKDVKILQKPHDTFYGQRRLLMEDLNGFVIDVSSPMG